MHTLRVAARWCLCVGALMLGFVWFRTVPAAGGQSDPLAARGLLAARTAPAPVAAAGQPGLVKLTPPAATPAATPAADFQSVARPALPPAPPATLTVPAAPAMPAAGGPATPERRVRRRVCRITAYCDRGTTACGVQSGVGQCAAPADIPFGTKIYIPALKRTLIVTDRTHKRFRHNTVDIFMPSYSACMNFGVKYLEIEYDPAPTKKKRR